MNPFIESTVARVALSSQWRGLRAPSVVRHTRSGRRAWRYALGAMLVSAALGVAAPPAYALDVNQASAQQLETIRGIGPRTAEVIVNERERGGKFESFEDLAERVRGIGQKKAQALQAAGLTVGEGESPAAVGAGAAASAVERGKPADAKPAAATGATGAARSSKSAAGPAARP